MTERPYPYDDDELDQDRPSLAGAAEAARRRGGDDRLYEDPPLRRPDYDRYGDGRYGDDDRHGGGHYDDPYDDGGYDDGRSHGRDQRGSERRLDGVNDVRDPRERRKRRPAERVIYEGNPHWTGLLGFYFKGVSAVTVAGALALAISQTGMFSIGWGIVGLLAGYAAVYGIGRLIIRSTRYSVSTRRIIKRWGIVYKHQEEASLQRIQNIQVNVTLTDRLLRIGAIDFDTAAIEDPNQLRFWGVKRPFDVHGKLMADEEFNDQLY